MKKSFLCLSILIILTGALKVNACSAFFLSKKGVKVFGRTHDFKTSRGFVLVRKKNIQKKCRIFKGFRGENIRPVKWTGKYDNITFHSEEKPNVFIPIGGLNSEGLGIAELYVNDDNTINVSFAKTDRALMCSRWVEYVLDNYKNVDEVIKNITDLKLVNNFHAHWFLCDKSGISAIIEYINGNLVINYGQPLTIPALTNHPYVYSCNELKKYSFLGGKIKDIPKGHKSIERFVRGAYLLFSYNGDSPVKYMSKLLNDVFRPASTDSPTQWKTIYDLVNMKIYYRIRNKSTLKSIDFNKAIKNPDNTKIAIFKIEKTDN